MMFYENRGTCLLRVLRTVILISSSIILFVLIISDWFNISCPNLIRTLKKRVKWFFWDNHTWYFYEYCFLQWIKNPQSTVILKLCGALVSYYISKGFCFVQTKEGILDKFPIIAQNQINAVGKPNEDSLLTWNTEISLIVNTLNKIYIPRSV